MYISCSSSVHPIFVVTCDSPSRLGWEDIVSLDTDFFPKIILGYTTYLIYLLGLLFRTFPVPQHLSHPHFGISHYFDHDFRHAAHIPLVCYLCAIPP